MRRIILSKTNKFKFFVKFDKTLGEKNAKGKCNCSCI